MNLKTPSSQPSFLVTPGRVGSPVAGRGLYCALTLRSVLACVLWSSLCLYSFFTEEMREVRSDERLPRACKGMEDGVSLEQGIPTTAVPSPEPDSGWVPGVVRQPS